MRFTLVLLVFAALGLGACANMVVSDEPVLTAADTAPAWTLKPGIWTAETTDGEAACVFDPRRHIRSWPDCAEPLLIEDPSVMAVLGLDQVERDWILAEAEPDLFVAQGVPRNPDASIDFSLVSRLARDAKGDATLVRFGWLFCGPPPPEGAILPNGEARSLTTAPYPGAILGEQNCTPDGRDGLLSLARANRVTGMWGQIRWRRAAKQDELVLLRRRKEEMFQKAQSTMAE